MFKRIETENIYDIFTVSPRGTGGRRIDKSPQAGYTFFGGDRFFTQTPTITGSEVL